MDVVSLVAKERQGRGKGPAGRLRRQGYLPGILYGKEVGNIPLAVEAKELRRILLDASANALLRLQLKSDHGTSEYYVVIHELQRHPLKGELLHVDIHQVSLSEKIVTEVAVQLTGEAVGVQQGGVLQYGLRAVEVTCLPAHIPGAITADISALEIGDSLKVVDLEVPPEVEILSEPEAMVATIILLKHREEAEEQPAEVPGEEKTADSEHEQQDE